MAKKFAGFTPEQMGKIIPEMQGMQADEQAAYLASQPGAAARVGKMAEVAQKRIGMAEGGMAVSLEDRLAAQKRGFLSAGQRQAFNYNNMNTIGNTMVAPPISGNQLSPGVPTTVPETLARPFGNLRDLLERTPRQGIMPVSRDSLPAPVPLPFPMPLEGGPRQSPPAQQPQQVAPHSHTIGMHRGGYAEGGDTGSALQDLDKSKEDVSNANKALQDALAAQKADPTNEDLAKAVTGAQTELDASGARFSQAESIYKTVGMPGATEIKGTAATDPSRLVTKADTATVSDEDKAKGEIDPTTGKLTGEAPTADLTKADTAPEVKAPTATETVVYEPVKASSGVGAVMDRLTAATGKPSEEALAEAAQMSPEDLASLGLSVAQIEQARTVIAPDARTIQEGELIGGSTVDMGRVKKETNFEAATGSPSTDATVQGQLTGLMEQFEGSEPPAFAAGAMRIAAAQMAARGLSASSMAGQAMIQAAMESAIPIAQQDASTFAKFEAQNLSNKQQAAMFAAEKRAEFLGLEFSQDFQSRVANAAKISDVANMNFTAEQQIALENARMAQTVDITNLNATNAKIMADAAALNNVDMANLNNRQSAAVQNAQAFLQMDMTNLANEQQTSVFKAQQLANALLSDSAAANAARQFNATSQNQTDQFFASLATNVALHNNEQMNGMNRFNAGEANSINQFNATAREARNQFNSTNALVIAQANAAWSQAITTAATAAQNQNNRDAAMSSNEFTMAAYNAIVQEERDLVSFVFNAAQKQMDRDAGITLQSMQNESQRLSDQASIDVAGGQGFGTIIGALGPTILRGVFGNNWGPV